MGAAENPSATEAIGHHNERADAWMIRTQIIGKAQDGRWNPETAENVALNVENHPQQTCPDPERH